MSALLITLIVVAIVIVSGTSVLVATRSRRHRQGPVTGERSAPLLPPVIAPPPSSPTPPRPTESTTHEAPLVPAGTGSGGPVPSLRARLGSTRDLFSTSLSRVKGRPRVDEESFSELEEALILADVGLPTTTRLLDELRERVRSGAISPDPDALLADLERAIIGLFGEEDRSLHLATRRPAVWIFVGVNGVGKTTTIGKVAAQQIQAGRTVVLAAGDTFRAAAGDQLALWAERSQAGFVRGADGADPSSVVFDAVGHAAARGADLVLADSAGRLHTKTNLMEELKKLRRIADRPPGEVAEVLLVLDATTGQNGLVQAREFTNAVEVTGVVLTKLDGTAKGGVVLAIRSELDLPIKLVGVGEQIDDLIAFDPQEFASALFG